MKYALAFFGFAGGLALVFPKVVATAYFFLIIPGLVLTVMPTIFVYLAATAMIRRVLTDSPTIASTIAAFGAAIVLGWAVMQPFRMFATNRYDASLLPDVEASEKIELHGKIRLERNDRTRDPECDYLCLALLDSPDVDSVTVVTTDRSGEMKQNESAAFSLVESTADAPPGIFPVEVGHVVRNFRPLADKFRGRKIRAASQAVEAYWSMRLAGTTRLQRVKPVESMEADWIVRIDDNPSDRKNKLRRVTITDSQDRVHFRQSYRKCAVPASIFYFGFEAYCAGGPISSASFCVGRQTLTQGDGSLNVERRLLTAVSFSAPPIGPEIVQQLRTKVQRALDDPNLSSDRLDIAKRFLGLHLFDASKDDYALIARIVGDRRVSDIDQQIKNVFSRKKTPADMRDAFAKRIAMKGTSSDLRYWMAESLANMPSGTFSSPSPECEQIWRTPALFEQAAPFLASAADLDMNEAMQILTSAIEHLETMDDRRAQRRIATGIRDAFVRMGPKAASAAPRINKLFLRRPSPLLANSNDADQWRFALARMGVAIDDLPMFPSQSPNTAERIRKRVTRLLEIYDRREQPQPRSKFTAVKLIKE